MVVIEDYHLNLNIIKGGKEDMFRFMKKNYKVIKNKDIKVLDSRFSRSALVVLRCKMCGKLYSTQNVAPIGCSTLLVEGSELPCRHVKDLGVLELVDINVSH